MDKIIVISIILMIFLGIISIMSGDILIFWLVLELMSLSLAPCIISNSFNANDSLMNYIFAISISSSLMLVGLLYSDFFFFFFLGFWYKFGVFPCILWLYSVFCQSKSWLVCWGISVLMKVPLLGVSYFIYGLDSLVIFLCVVFGLVFSSLMFWLYSLNWFCVWGHIVVSSSCLLFYLISMVDLSDFILLFLLYIIWSTGVLVYLGLFNGFYGYLLFLVSLPLGFNLVYKVMFSFYLISLSFYIMVIWVIYCFMEQLYLFKWLVSNVIVKSVWINKILVW
uniref:NADH dehydrogenase subunit 2 n=1 Tax=Schistosoma spindalis TaxID=6189 RepID=A0A6G9KAX3_SCHSI|nr:NADH dehydrogenase subunit 2 [Schistosoma spindale]